jgi:DNA-directed RNA polymerase specialized sigma24 family protein
MDSEILRLGEPTAKVSAPPAASPDAELVAFYRQHRLGLVRLAVLLVGDQETAEDVVQDVFARLHGRWRPGVTTIAYVRTCVLNGSRSILRRRALALGRETAALSHGKTFEKRIRRNSVTSYLAVIPPSRGKARVINQWFSLLSITGS